MENIFEQIKSFDIDKIEDKLSSFAKIIGNELPDTVKNTLNTARKIAKYPSYSELISNESDEITDNNRLITILEMLKHWENIINKSQRVEYIIQFTSTVKIGPQNPQLDLLHQIVTELIPAVLFSQPHRLPELESRFDDFSTKYIHQYIELHQQHNEKIKKLTDKINDLIDEITIMEKLSCVELLKPYCEIPDIEKIRNIIVKEFTLCDYPICEEDIKQHFICPQCRFTMADFYDAVDFSEIASIVNPAFKKCMKALVSNLADKIMDKENNTIDALVKAVSVSDINSIKNIFSEKFVNRVKTLLEE